MKKYIKIMRIDHWVKQLFIIPGIIFAMVLLKIMPNTTMILPLILGFLSTCFIASSNYVINEWLDRHFDKYHPIKKHRELVSKDVKPYIIYLLYAILTIIGLTLGYFVNLPFLLVVLWLWIMGILYNVKPFRTKDIAFFDVLTESINNAIRLLLGWFIVTNSYYPPISLIIGYWFAGAFLMATKRFSEFRMFNNPKEAGKYRKSFQHYSLKSLLISSFFYAMSSNLFLGVFLTKYRVELIIFMPFLMGLYCYYFYIAFKEDSVAQKPEKLIFEKGLVAYVLGLCLLFGLLMYIDIPFLENFTNADLIEIKK